MSLIFVVPGLNLTSQFNLENVTYYNTKPEEYSVSRKQVNDTLITRLNQVLSSWWMSSDPVSVTRFFRSFSVWYSICLMGPSINYMFLISHFGLPDSTLINILSIGVFFCNIITILALLLQMMVVTGYVVSYTLHFLPLSHNVYYVKKHNCPMLCARLFTVAS